MSPKISTNCFSTYLSLPLHKNFNFDVVQQLITYNSCFYKEKTAKCLLDNLIWFHDRYSNIVLIKSMKSSQAICITGRFDHTHHNIYRGVNDDTCGKIQIWLTTPEVNIGELGLNTLFIKFSFTCKTNTFSFLGLF